MSATRTPSARVDQAEAALTRLLELFESGSFPERVAETMIRRRQDDGTRPSDAWSLSNQLLQLLAGTSDGRGFKQWQGVGRKVCKGSRAFYILAPMKRTIDDEKTGEKKTIVFGFKAIPVFRLEDTEGDDLPPAADYTPEQLPPLYDVAQDLGVSVTYAAAAGAGYRGYYQPGAERIVLLTEDVTTFFHELAHAAHNKVRPLKNGQDPRQEIVAETTAHVLALMYGFTGYEWKGYEYVHHYGTKIGKDPVRAIASVLADVQKTLELILSSEAAPAPVELEAESVAA